MINCQKTKKRLIRAISDVEKPFLIFFFDLAAKSEIKKAFKAAKSKNKKQGFSTSEKARIRKYPESGKTEI